MKGRLEAEVVELFNDVAIHRALFQYLRAVIFKYVDGQVFIFQFAPQPSNLTHHQLTGLESVEAYDNCPGLGLAASVPGLAPGRMSESVSQIPQVRAAASAFQINEFRL